MRDVIDAARAAERRDAGWVFAVALCARLAVVVWARSTFPPAADGQYYHVLATRLARGLGYTWAWPDGAVTAAAHYPVGYPALLAPLYALFAPSPTVAMALGAVLGALGAAAASRLTRPFGRRASLVAGLVVGLHPALVPYTAALMTEGVAAAALVVAAALLVGDAASPPRGRALASAGVVMGLVTLIRPQCVVLAPVLGALAGGVGWALVARARAAAIVTACALAVVAPWTARNCVAMHRCALVSVNGGWNLLIGTATRNGAWQPVDVPPACREVWDEAGKDSCFEREARLVLARDPWAAIARAPAKLDVTFDYFGAAPWYLHEANPAAFDDEAKKALGTVDLVASRLALLFALVALGRRALASRRVGDSPRIWASSLVLVTMGAISAVSRHATFGYLALAAALLADPAWRRDRSRLVLPFTGAVVLSVAATHAVFFGAGRYGLVVLPLVSAVAALTADRPLAKED